MANRVRTVLERLLGRATAAGADGVPDTELLRRFVTTADEAAFELLVWRHGAMVLGVCRRAVRDEQLAEDAFQATFLVLARKAGAVRGANLAGWLFRIARRVSARALKRRLHGTPVPDQPAEAGPCPVERRELADLLDAEVSRLPDRLRRVVVLCYLGGRSTEEAARELGCPRGTILSRLAAARKRLVERLTRRGVTLPAALAVAGEQTTGRLVSQTVAAIRNPIPGAAPTASALLAESVVRAMATTKLATACGAVLLAAGLTLGVGWVTASGPGATEPVTASAAPGVQPEQPKPQPKKDADPKPPTPAEKAAILRKQAHEIAQRIEEVQHRIARDEPEPENVDIAALLSELFAIDKGILIQENEAKSQARELDQALKLQAAAPKEPLDDRRVADVVSRTTEVQLAAQKVLKAGEVLATLRKSVAAESPILEAAKKEVEDATAAHKAATEKARPEVERKLRAEAEKGWAEAVASVKRQIEVVAERLKELHDKRQQLVTRIARAREQEAKRQVLQDELRVLREIQMEVMRQQTLAELGIEALPPARVRPEADPQVEAQLRDLRREVEVLRAEVEKLRGKK